ncbi:MAG: MFS transporter [Acinetobacter sp.]|uniref:MFS transporter n=1 Tax=Acinetobacter sp. TaxID=472 RepID=UPI000FBA0CEE|nr:MFS transporter [Acinetobacter sp.]RUP42013.1 MAG: MFS transporter [Acinetobacter sp.]
MFKNIVYSPLASLVFLILSSSFYMTFITVKLNLINVPESLIGYIHSSFYAGMFLGPIKCKSLINRVGHIRAYAVFVSITTGTVIMQGLWINSYWWIILRFFAGVSLSGCYLVIESWLLATSTKKTKGKILAIFMICLYSSQSISQFFLEIIDISSMEPFMLSAVLSTLAIIPACVTYMKPPQVEAEVTIKISMVKYFTKAPFGFIGCLVSGLILSSIYSFMPSYALHHNVSVSLFMGIIVAGGFIMQWPIGKISDILDRTRVITINSILTIFACTLILMYRENTIVLYIVSFFIGGFTFTIYPISIAHTCDYFSQEDIVNATGISLFAYGFGSIIGSSMTAFFIELYSSEVIFHYIALSSLVLVLFGTYRIITVKPIPQEALNPLSTLPETINLNVKN